ncbi:hypothetical protein [Deferribacter autotrophicus]|nr:hypothetical protein [Deferribacter autotrophicus]
MNGFEIHNACMDSPTFVLNETFFCKGQKHKVTYLAKANILQWYDMSVVGGTYSFYEDLKSDLYPGYVSSVSAAVDTYNFCNYIDDNTDYNKRTLCKRFKEKAQTFFVGLKSVVWAVIHDKKPNFEGDLVNGEVNVTIQAEHKGFKTKKEYITVDTTKIGKIIISGYVKDDLNNPIPNARILLPEYGNKEISANINGYYKIDLTLDTQGKVANFTQDIVMHAKIGKLNVEILASKLVANGKFQNLKFKVSSPQKNMGNKTVEITFAPNGYIKNGKTVNYLTKTSFIKKVKLNANGIGVVKEIMPSVKKEKLNNIFNPSDYFPVTAKLVVEYPEADAKGETNVQLYSPFPKIKRVTIPGGIDEGLWQITPSTITIEDLDSNSFNIEVRGFGRFKLKGGHITKTVLKEYRFTGNQFQFYYGAYKMGLDLNKEPDLWKELLITNLKVLGNFFITISEADLLKRVQKFKGNINLTNRITSDKVTSLSKLRFAMRDFYHNTLSYYYDKDKDYVKTADLVVGGVSIGYDIYSMIKKLSPTLGQSLQLETAKAIYENAKTIHKIYKQYRKISDSYQDVVFIPIYISVSDGDGYTTNTIRSISVKIWKEVD